MCDSPVSDRKKSKKSKRSKDHKKKKSKHKKRSRHSSSSASTSSSEEGGGWVERRTKQKEEGGGLREKSTEKVNESSKRDDWMNLESIIPTYSKKDIPRKEKPEIANQKLMMEKPGQSEQELNPYWKDGGKGLPSTAEDSKKSAPRLNVGDGGVSWLRKAYQRAIEQANEEGRSLAEVAAERWGSLEKIEGMLRDAEETRAKPRFARPSDDWGGRGRKFEFARPKDDEQDHARRREDERPWRKREGREEERAWKKKIDVPREKGEDHERERERNRDSDRDRERNRDIDRNREGNRDSDRGRYRDDNQDRERNRSSDRDRERHRDSNHDQKGNRDSERKQDRIFGPERPHDSSSDSDVPQKKHDRVSDKSPAPEVAKKSPARALTELERNEIGAKLIKAELLGNTKLASELKQQLEESKTVPVTSGTGNEKLSQKELNQLSAKMMKAELMGDVKLVNELKKKMEDAKMSSEEVVVLATTSKDGFTRPLYESEEVGYAKRDSRRKKRKVETHRDGQRERYFADDDKYSLKEMFEKERLTNAEDHNAEFARMIGKDARKANADFDIDDIFEAKANREDKNAHVRMRDRALNEHKTVKKSLESCQWCIDGKEIQKHLIISAGDKAFLALPAHNSLTTGHCVIAPVSHVPCGTQLDEDVWEEIQKYRKEIVKMFLEQDQDVVFMETAMRLRHFPHMTLHCIPMPRETGDLAPIYFKKAINECEREWANNVKLVDLKGKDIRSAVPKGLPYFSVDFGMESGFAHVIEDEQDFPHYFGAEIIGGMLDLDPYLWRKPRKENFDVQCKKSVEFTNWWKPHEFNDAN